MPDALIAPVWLAATCLLAGTAWVWSGRLVPADSSPQRAMHTLVLCWAGIVGTGTFLGAVGLLSGYALLGSTAALSGGLLWLARRPGGANRAWRGSAAPVTSPAPETAAG